MKKILTTAILAGSTAATFAAIIVTPTDGAFDTGVNPRTGTESLTVQAGDVVVLMASTNKKPTGSTIAFTTTSADALIHHDTATETGNNTDPDQWGSYTTITSGGTFDFTLTAQIDTNTTLKWVAYVLHSDTATTIELLDVAAIDNFDLANGITLNFSNTYSWTGTRDATILEASAETRGLLSTTNGFTIDETGGGRVVAHGAATGTGFDSDYSLLSNEADITRVASSGVLGFAFSETVPEPSSAALLGIGGLALLFRRKK